MFVLFKFVVCLTLRPDCDLIIDTNIVLFHGYPLLNIFYERDSKDVLSGVVQYLFSVSYLPTVDSGQHTPSLDRSYALTMDLIRNAYSILMVNWRH